jgi:[ribosomal protein S5]-alanine N-acetyltransferase
VGPVVFSSARFDLRPWTREDLTAVDPVLNDPAVVWWDAEAGDESHARDILERIVGQTEQLPAGYGWLAIVDRATGEAVGNLVVRDAQFDPGSVELGWHVRRASWGQGIAPEAARAGMAFAAADRMGEAPVVFAAVIHPDNTRSQHVAEKLGMTRVREIEFEGEPHELWRAPV